MPSMDQATQLMLLKTVTLRTGGIHDAQRLQLQMWPRLIRGVTASTVVEIDMERKLVKFSLGTDRSFRLNATTRRLLKEITGWTRFILWSETDVVFVAKSKVVHDTRT